MPAKRNELPRPCPKCGSYFGTVQIVFFHGMRKVKKQESRYEAWNNLTRPTHRHSGGHDNAVFRIGHYDSKLYKKTKVENNKSHNFESEEIKKKKLRTSQRRWCSFRSDILEDSKFSKLRWISKTFTFPFFDDVWTEVYDNGWQMIK